MFSIQILCLRIRNGSWKCQFILKAVVAVRPQRPKNVCLGFTRQHLQRQPRRLHSLPIFTLSGPQRITRPSHRGLGHGQSEAGAPGFVVFKPPSTCKESGRPFLNSEELHPTSRHRFDYGDPESNRVSQYFRVNCKDFLFSTQSEACQQGCAERKSGLRSKALHTGAIPLWPLNQNLVIKSRLRTDPDVGFSACGGATVGWGRLAKQTQPKVFMRKKKKNPG